MADQCRWLSSNQTNGIRFIQHDTFSGCPVHFAIKARWSAALRDIRNARSQITTQIRFFTAKLQKKNAICSRRLDRATTRQSHWLQSSPRTQNALGCIGTWYINHTITKRYPIEKFLDETALQWGPVFNKLPLFMLPSFRFTTRVEHHGNPGTFTWEGEEIRQTCGYFPGTSVSVSHCEGTCCRLLRRAAIFSLVASLARPETGNHYAINHEHSHTRSYTGLVLVACHPGATEASPLGSIMTKSISVLELTSLQM